MIKSYRQIHQWNYWLNYFLGQELLAAENEMLIKFLDAVSGKHAVLIGVPQQYSLLEKTFISDHCLLTPLASQDKSIRCVEGDWSELPISSGTVDVVVLPHTLEHTHQPRKILQEACRIVKPEGSIIIFGFNPYSLWGLQKKWGKKQEESALLGREHFLSAISIKQWLLSADFELVKQKTFFFRPPLTQPTWFQKLKFMEWIGRKCHLPFGGVYVLMAKAKVIPLTPIRLHWKQELPQANLTIPGPSIRNF